MNELDFRGDGSVGTMGFVDYIKEPRRVYDDLLFEAVNISCDQFMTFSEYCHIVTFFSMLGKRDIMKLIFSSSCKDFLKRDDWISIIDKMLSKERIQYSKRIAILAYNNNQSCFSTIFKRLM